MRSTTLPFVAVPCAAVALLVLASGPVTEALAPQLAEDFDVVLDGGAPAPTRVADLVAPPTILAEAQRVVATEAAAPVQPEFGSGPIDPKGEALVLPLQLVLDSEADASVLMARYEFDTDEALVRQQERLLRLVQGQYDPANLTRQQRLAVDQLMRDVDALNYELQWIQGEVWTRLNADDPGYRLLTPKSLEVLQRDSKNATREDLRVLEWQLDRQRFLEETRACDLLIHQGRYVDEPSQIFL